MTPNIKPIKPNPMPSRCHYLPAIIFISLCTITPSVWALDTNAIFATVNGALASVLFFDIGLGMPLIVAWLVIGAIFLTVRMGFINLWAMGHAIQILRGRYRCADDQGEVTPFQALATALSATVGLGNIAGVAIAIAIGGPGATFWMIIGGLLGMTSKFTEATLAQAYRQVRPDGQIRGGAMEYLWRGFAEYGWPRLGYALAIVFCVFTIGGSLGAGNAFQVNQAFNAVQQSVSWPDEQAWIFGSAMAFLVSLVIIGGIQRIALVAQALVPLMVLIYLSAALWVIASHYTQLPDAVSLIWSSALSLEAGVGGLIGIIVQGFKRAVFSSEAGIGSAAIAHATAQSKYPVRQGLVALLEPFIDTVIICTMTALVIIITGVYSAPEHAQLVENVQGAALTSVAFGSVISWFPLVLSVCVILFAFSTMIAWFYYGERCWSFICGERGSLIYKIVFIAFTVMGAVTGAGHILTFSELLVLGMALPNFIGLYLLNNKVKKMLDQYWKRLQNGSLYAEAERESLS